MFRCGRLDVTSCRNFKMDPLLSTGIKRWPNGTHSVYQLLQPTNYTHEGFEMQYYAYRQVSWKIFVYLNAVINEY
jgi:hypothetical protein